jgi:hypothetical protein
VPAVGRPRVWGIVVCDDTGATLARVCGTRPASVPRLEALLDGHLARVTALVAPGGPIGAWARFCESHGIAFRSSSPGCQGPSAPTPHARAAAQRLRTWLRPFRGVASHNLDRYLRWFTPLDQPPMRKEPHASDQQELPPA